MGEGKVARRDLVLNVFVWTANVSTSVVIIFVIKSLMSVYRFKYATTVSGLHFVCCAWAVWGLEKAGMIEPADMPLRTSLMFALVGAMSVGFANLSLLLNSVGFYQMAKLLMSPFVAAVEMLWLKKRFPAPALACIVVVLTGVGIVTVSDVTVNGPGLAMAALFIVMGGSQQILCGHLQNVLQLQSHQLMSNTSFLQGMILMIVGPFVDKLASSKWVLEWEVSVPGVEMLALSCLLAVAVNGTQYLVLGRFSATSFQVLGHAKTLLVLIGGWLLFDDPINPRKALGMALAFLGMIGYGYFASRPVPSGPSAAAAALQNLETHKGPDLTAAPKRPSTESGSSAALDGGYKPSTSAELDLEQPLLSWAARSGAGPTRKLRDEEAVVPGRTW
ncbi:hypothetical protein Vretimale_1165 [Volvox reticuliferus]|uniref:Sugar phosphate transporter domain-containing protein n=2 Tax=Volvox reticuliferus TaxID=1737510 RepID=A0A8J4CE88_9CHLO|nr:hypothetical protein Vretifemale_10293 [Volvox reticuliferus]GIL95105.1 hypothetical protein Vretimale_1165 [Volvox reticuliferus]